MRTVREKLHKQEATVGSWLQIPSPDVAEILGRMGYDWVAVDMEHGAFSRSELPNMFRAIERWGTSPFARLPEATPYWAKAAVDSGARGVIFPMIESGAQLDAAIKATIYPGGKEFSEGGRGVGFSRSNMYGADFSAQTQTTGHDIVLVAQIEHVEAVANIDSILTHPRLDAYMVGPYDLSASMGLTGQFTHPRFVEALETIARSAQAHGVAKGIHVVQPDEDELRAKIAAGYSFLAYGIDAVFLMATAINPLS